MRKYIILIALISTGALRVSVFISSIVNVALAEKLTSDMGIK